MWFKGFASEEAKTALARAREMASRVDAPAERLADYYGQWANAFMRAMFTSAPEIAEAFLREAENRALAPETSAGHRMLGLTLMCQGDFSRARLHLTEALNLYELNWSHDEKFRLTFEPGVTAMAYLAITEWASGHVGLGRQLIDESVTRAVEIGHVPTLGCSYELWARCEALRGDPLAAERVASIAVDYTREQELRQFYLLSRICLAWARARQAKNDDGLVELRDSVAAYTESGNRVNGPLFLGLLAEVEAEEQVEIGLSCIDAAIEFANDTGEHYTDAILHRIRGDILRRSNPAIPSPEEAYQAALSIARQQGARMFELQAALPLARLLQSANRPLEARDVLAPALEGFAPTPELLAISEAQALLAALSG